MSATNQDNINTRTTEPTNSNTNTPNQQKATMMMDSYRVGNSGAIKRIGTPHENDVLSGRGGAINSHPGNQRFREMVRERKNQYNLARTKAEKARVANEVIDLVRNQNPPGRFLQRDQSSVTGGVTWWVEVDEIKAMAKTSQALREGAPSIRAAHKDELQDTKRRRKSKKINTSSAAQQKMLSSTSSSKRSHETMQQQQSATTSQVSHPNVDLNTPMPPLELSKTRAIEQLKANVEAAKNSSDMTSANTSTAPYNTTMVAPPSVPYSNLTNTTYSYGRPVKRSRLSENLYLPRPQTQPHIVKPDEETPPLEPMPSPVPLSAIPELGGETFPMPAIPKREPSLYRANSLALSDIGNGSDTWGDVEFVNPFEGDSDETNNNDRLINSPPPMSPFDQKTSSGVRSRNSLSNMSVKSLASDLSDLVDSNALSPSGVTESDFGEGMKAVYDAVHPGLTSPGNDEPIPTHLYPYRGSIDLRREDSWSSPQLIF